MCKFAKISSKTLEDFWEARFLHDAINKAINKAKLLGFTEANCQPLIIEKLKVAKDFKDSTQEILDSCMNSNLVKFNESWYGIVCMIGKKASLMVCPLHPEHLDEIYIDFSSDKAKLKEEHSQFIKDNMNREVLDDYKNKIVRKQDEILNKFFDCTDHLIKEKQKFLITSHCIQRWDERIKHGNGKFKNDKRKGIVNSIIKSFLKAKFVYSSESIGSNFYLDKDNMVFYAVSDDNIILTLWKNDYGFTDEKINNITTMLQLKYITECQKKLYKAKHKVENVILEKKNRKCDLDLDISTLDGQIEALNKQKQLMIEEKNKISQEIANNEDIVFEYQRQLQHEESLIFKSHKTVNE